MKLHELQEAVEAGETVQDENIFDGWYRSLYKADGAYYTQSDFEFEKHTTFDDAIEHIALDEEEFSREECSWEIQPPQTPEEQAYWAPFADAFAHRDVNAGVAFLLRHGARTSERIARLQLELLLGDIEIDL